MCCNAKFAIICYISKAALAHSALTVPWEGGLESGTACRCSHPAGVWAEQAESQSVRAGVHGCFEPRSAQHEPPFDSSETLHAELRFAPAEALCGRAARRPWRPLVVCPHWQGQLQAALALQQDLGPGLIESASEAAHPGHVNLS